MDVPLLNPFASYPGIGIYRPTFGQQYLDNGKSNYCLYRFLKECSISFIMVRRLIDFALVVLKLLMFKVCAIIDFSKIEFFDFSGTERVINLFISF